MWKRMRACAKRRAASLQELNGDMRSTFGREKLLEPNLHIVDSLGR